MTRLKLNITLIN